MTNRYNVQRVASDDPDWRVRDVALYDVEDTQAHLLDREVCRCASLACATHIAALLNGENALASSLKEMVAAYGSDDGGGPITIIERARAALLNQEGT